jgi:hypothetical protein
VHLPPEVPVWLGTADPPGPGPVTVHIGRCRLGELRPGDAALLEQDLQRARQQDKTLSMCGRHIPRSAATRTRLLLHPGVPFLLTFPFPPGPGLALLWAASFEVFRPPGQQGGEAKGARHRSRARYSRSMISWPPVRRSLPCSSL